MPELSQQTYYEILNIPPTADAKQIRKAYLTLSLKYHPDKNLENAELARDRFIEIGQAYDVLKDPVERASYDREIALGRWSKNRQSSQWGNVANSKTYEDYRDAFSSQMAGMSESDVQAAESVASVVGSLLGSFVGAHLGKKGGCLGKVAGSLLGSALGSDMAKDAVRGAHRTSVDLVEGRERGGALGGHGGSQRSADSGVQTKRSNMDKWKRAFSGTKNAFEGIRSNSQRENAFDAANVGGGARNMIRNGTRVILTGLSRENLNGKIGTVINYDSNSQRYVIQLNRDLFKFRPKNLSPIV